MKRAQITIFIVLGLVIMIIFGLMYFVKNSTSDIVLEKRINKIYGDFLTSTGIKDYVSTCLDRSIRDAIILASLQGGKIYSYQVEGGYSLVSPDEIVPFNYSGDLYNVSYGIKAPVISLPNYPYPGDLVENPRTIDISFSSVFAKVENDIIHPYSLTSLCNYYGKNYFNISDAAYTCETATKTNESIQQYLLVYIINRTKSCVNFPQFSKQTSYNITEGNITGFVLVGDDDVFVDINYPILVSYKGSIPKTNFLEFVSKPKLRLKKVHELAAHLIGFYGRLIVPNADSNNIFFNISRDDPHDCLVGTVGRDQQCILGDMMVSKIKDYCLGNPACDLPLHYRYSDIINITDSRSLIDGKPLTFLFAVENRAPALNFTPSYPSIISGDVLEVVGYDPDEDDLSYSYSNDDGSTFTNMIGRNFTPSSSGDYRIRVSDNEGLYDYQDVSITVVP